MDLDVSVKTWVAAGVIGVATCAAVYHSRPEATPPRWKTLGPELSHAFYAEAMDAELKARAKSEQRFRGSPWSQDDDFHNKESKFIRAYGKTHRIPIEALIDALDRGMREHWSTPSGAAPDQKIIACRPRLSY